MLGLMLIIVVTAVVGLLAVMQVSTLFGRLSQLEQRVAFLAQELAKLRRTLEADGEAEGADVASDPRGAGAAPATVQLPTLPIAPAPSAPMAPEPATLR